MAVAWGNFEDMTRWYLRCIGGLEEKPVVLFQRVDTGNYAVARTAEYIVEVELNEPGTCRIVMAMGAEEFIGLMLVQVSDIVEVVANADAKKGVQAGDEPRDLFAGVDAGTDREREGQDVCGGGDTKEAHQTLPESDGTVG